MEKPVRLKATHDGESNMWMKWNQGRARAVLDKCNQNLYAARLSLKSLMEDTTSTSEKVAKARENVREVEEELDELLGDWRIHTPRKYVPKYTPDWPEVAMRVKEAADWTCVSCGAVLKFGPHRKLLHVHHVNHSTTNNHPDNLVPLCVVCHEGQDGHDGIRYSKEDLSIIEKCRKKEC